MIQQLCIHGIFERNKGAFHARFRDDARPSMERHGFRFLAIWESSKEDRTELVYLLDCPTSGR